MREFDSLLEFSLHLVEQVHHLDVALAAGLEQVAAAIQYTAQSKLGTYQGASGPHPGWPELAEATKDDRVRLGFSENDPLYRTGELQASITRDVGHLEAAIGVKHGQAHSPYEDGGSTPDMGDLAVWQEFGTSKMPARPFLGPAGFENRENIQKMVGAAVVAGIIGDGLGGSLLIHPALGYNFSVKDYGFGS